MIRVKPKAKPHAYYVFGAAPQRVRDVSKDVLSTGLTYLDAIDSAVVLADSGYRVMVMRDDEVVVLRIDPGVPQRVAS